MAFPRTHCPVNGPFSGSQSTVSRSAAENIQRRLDRDIHDFRLMSFNNFAIEVSVEPAKDAGEVLDAYGNLIGHDSYDFEAYSKTPKTMWTRMSPFHPGCVEIWYRQKWRPVHAYLKRLKPAIDWNIPISNSKHETQARRAEQQQRWWTANGKALKFTELPAEVREIIYEYAIGPRVEPYPTAKARKLGRTGCAAIVARMPNASLLLTNKVVYREASNVLFRRTSFFIDRKGVLTRLLQNEAQRSRVRRLELALSHLEFFKVFGMHCKDEVFYEPRSPAYEIQNMRFDRLTLRFAAPSATTSADWLDNACQKGVVDWILDEAWPFIRRHAASNVVDLRGYIKRSSRSLFQSYVKDERQDIDRWQRQRLASGEAEGQLHDYYEILDEEIGGVAFDMEKRMFEVAAEEQRRLFPLTCHCRKRCDGKRWSSRD